MPQPDGGGDVAEVEPPRPHDEVQIAGRARRTLAERLEHGAQRLGGRLEVWPSPSKRRASSRALAVGARRSDVLTAANMARVSTGAWRAIASDSRSMVATST